MYYDTINDFLLDVINEKDDIDKILMEHHPTTLNQKVKSNVRHHS